ncbi:hypothetical protein CRG98_022070 [Punica granatum]|uniref:Uncharacterized protein n=1 Tax=Punica granatum TaxID=22663 RepID=A0A2I0JMV2_PUNGR|nr:hypothetical protein CRG98_022070 [Punica granatum]
MAPPYPTVRCTAATPLLPYSPSPSNPPSLPPLHPSTSSSFIALGLHSSFSLSSQSTGPSPCYLPPVSTALIEYAALAFNFDFVHDLNCLRALQSRLSSANSLQEDALALVQKWSQSEA